VFRRCELVIDRLHVKTSVMNTSVTVSTVITEVPVSPLVPTPVSVCVHLVPSVHAVSHVSSRLLAFSQLSVSSARRPTAKLTHR